MGGVVYSKLSHKDLVRHIDEYGVVLKGGGYLCFVKGLKIKILYGIFERYRIRFWNTKVGIRRCCMELYRLLEFKDLGDERGKLVVVEGEKDIPFAIKRIFYIYGSDATVVRGQHANKESEFVLINVAGKSKIRLTDGHSEFTVELNRPRQGVYLPKMIWKDMYDFSSDSVLLVLASTHYDGREYIRDYEEYLSIVRAIK